MVRIIKAGVLKRVLAGVLVLVSFLPAIAAEFVFVIPEWFDVAYRYWNEGMITDEEFSNAISYLQRHELMWLVDKEDNPIANFLVTDAMKKQVSNGRSGFSDCSAGWYVTGYYTPLESEYSGKLIIVTIDGMSYEFKEDFVAEIKTEGWGMTVSGQYLGWYGESFHLSERPLDAAGNALQVGMVAVDPLVIPASSRLTIPSLPSPWDQTVFVGSDTGTAISGMHVDVYTGEGKDALDKAYRITGYDNVVCLEVE